MEGKLELILLPVADVDRAKAFYVDTCGFDQIVDHAPNEHFRIVQCQPVGVGVRDRVRHRHPARHAARLGAGPARDGHRHRRGP